MLASCPASILNHFSTRLGILFRVRLKQSRSSPGHGPRLAKRRRRWKLRTPSLATETTNIACLYPLLQQWPRPEPFTVRFEHDLLGLETQG